MKLIIIFAVVITLFATFEIYFYKKWKKYVTHKGWNQWIHRIPLLMSIFTIIAILAININRFYSTSSESWTVVLFMIISFWTLPKIIIVPIMFFQTVISFIKYKIFKRRIPEDTTRRKFLRDAGWTVAGIPFFASAWGVFRTAYDFKVHNVEVKLENLPNSLDGVRIVQISDLHAGSYYSDSPFRKVRYIIETLNPDIVVLTGDFVNNNHAEIDKISHEISKIKAKYGVYGCLGNHDHFMSPESHSTLVDKLKKTGMRLLINENHTVTIGDANLHIAGIDNTGFGQEYGNYEMAMQNLPDYETIILLAHDPTNWDKSIFGQLPVDLTLSGHTHGGQVGIELFGKMMTPVKMVYKQWAGLYHKKGQYLYVNRGVGMVGPPIRLGINPEITLLTLKKNNLLAKN